MRTIPLFILTSLVLLFAGCEAMSDKMNEQFSAPAPKVRAFDGDLRTVFTAAQLAFKRLDLVLTDSSQAPVSLEASSRIVHSDSLGDSRQMVVNLHLHELENGKTEVGMLISLQVENKAQGGLSAQNKREHVFYDIFFTTLEQVLQERTATNR